MLIGASSWEETSQEEVQFPSFGDSKARKWKKSADRLTKQENSARVPGFKISTVFFFF